MSCPMTSASTTRGWYPRAGQFWRDLEESLENPVFRAYYIEAYLEVAALMGKD